jgi:serine/threonine-protein kinase HipA
MSVRPPLPVFLYARHVADVLDTGLGDTAVRYTDTAIADPAGCRLSLSLPVHAATHPTAGPGGRWVRSLLPEGRALAWAVRAFGVPEDDRYGMIAVLGADVAGAVQVLSPGQTPGSAGRYVELAAGEVAEIVERAPQFGLGLDRERGVRLSLAGMQDKVLLHRLEGRYVLPVDGAPSTLIVKPEPRNRSGGGPDLDGLATNELLCLTLARLCELPAADASIDVFGETRAIVVERYDRILRADGRVERVHQEDLLGALGLDPLLKYEHPHVERLASAGGFADAAAFISRPGPTLRQLAALLSDHLGRARLTPFLAAVTFNVAIGNADAHARNYSLVLARDGAVTFAPLYDLISTRFWEGLDAEPAQHINGKEHLDEIEGADVVAEAERWGLPRGLVERRVTALTSAIRANLGPAVSACAERGGDRAVASAIASLIDQRLPQLRL